MKEKQIGYYFIVLASVVVVLAGIKNASSIIVPFLLSVFIAIILAPTFTYLKSKKIPSSLALIAVLGVFLLVVLFVVKLISTSVYQFSVNVDDYTEKLVIYYEYIASFLQSFGYSISIESLSEMLNAKQIMKFVSSMVQGVGSLFTNGFVIILTVAFMLLESETFIRKVQVSSQDSLEHIEEIFHKIKHYMVIKSLISFATAFVIYIALQLIGTDYPFLWAVLAFLLNFIPNIGSILAAVPAVLISLVQLGFMSASIVAGVYVLVNIVIGSIVEPKVMGKGLGVSTLVVFLSLIFWGWLLGIVGMFLSIPLTIMAKIIFNANEKTKWLALMLGDGDNLQKKDPLIIKQ
ncbi:AI-2E family transporter [Sulfurimonas sp. C5]|uniref:AI-2E family transporter n=1 Tax=Sulfurimonas sp. C5 TaxID=3036947 RepID=UPI00245760E4|nr:AI-2E family transporter [Sulfurimonas sp. C5]MDH4945269.1 AI-2E family transporter [Sulfurimonas sp. C5]